MTFEFNGFVIKVVKDRVGSEVEGCKKCLFYMDTEACADVDKPSTDRVSCCDGRHHYEEAADADIQ